MNFIHTNVAGNRIQAIRSARRSVILIRIRALIRIWVNQGFPAVSVWDDPCAYGQPICVRAAHTRTGCPYTYGLPIHVWDSPYAYGQNTCMGWNINTLYFSSLQPTYPGIFFIVPSPSSTLMYCLGHYLVISCFSSASRVCFCYPHFSPLLIISWLNLKFKKVLSMPTFIIIILAII